MKGIPPIVIIALFFAVTLGMPFGLYALLTPGRRRVVGDRVPGVATGGAGSALECQQASK